VLTTDGAVTKPRTISIVRNPAGSAGAGKSVLLKKMLNGTGTLLDIGAHIGTIALPIAVTGSQVVAIEMNPANCLRLVRGAIANRLRNFQVVPFAASDIDGMAAFAGTDAWGYISKESAAVPTMCVRLDTLAYSIQLGLEGASLAEPVVMKIDVECHELQVLRGCPIFCNNTGQSSFSNQRRSRGGPMRPLH
jgi:FkbM family methyltransferase